VALREQGLSIRAIASQVKVKAPTVQGIITRFNTRHHLNDLPKPGGPPKLNDRAKRLLARTVLTGETRSAVELAQVARAHYGIEISSRTALRLLHEQGLKVRHTIRKPRLTAAHKRSRLEFARAHNYWTVNDWKQVIFSDETVISAFPEGSHGLVWTKTADPLDPRLIVPVVQGGGARIMVWGCISKYGFHDLICFKDTVDAARYVEVLEEYLLPVVQQYFLRQPCIFQQDGASIHTARLTQEFFQAQDLQVLEWPPHSPDLNIIEHVWHYLKVELGKWLRATSKKDLWEKVQQILPTMWSPEMTEKMNDLYESLPRRMKVIIAARGGHTKY